MTTTVGDRSFFVWNAVVSAAALSFLFWLLVIHEGTSSTADLSFMPAVNASLNAAAAAMLAAGWLAIRNGKRELHKRLMVSAFACSALFLVGYVVYHAVHGDTRFQGEGPIRTFYFFILVSHILLSATVVPLALSSFYFAFRERFETHRKVARVTLPIWLYVSVTGVLIYFLLRGSVAAGS